MLSHIITGGAGFIGVNLARRLAERGDPVLLVDDLSRGRLDNLKVIGEAANVRFAKADCSDAAALAAAAQDAGLPPVTDVWHMAANSDIPAGVADLRIDLNRTLLTTTGALLFLRDNPAASLHFASSSAIYGDLADKAVDEDAGPLEPISYYGAMKLASEAQIRAAVEAFLPRADIFRFPNVVGAPATHGVLLDFIEKLQATPDQLAVLGDGTQRKPYLHVDDLVDAMLFIVDQAKQRYNVYNIGPKDDGVTVARIAEIVCEAVSPGARIAFGREQRGWVGDVPRFRYSTARLSALGWDGATSSEQTIRRAVDEIVRARAG